MPNPLATFPTMQTAYEIKRDIPKWGMLPAQDNYSEQTELLKRIDAKLDRILQATDYTNINGIWRKP